jgi:hypothetical protein
LGRVTARVLQASRFLTALVRVPARTNRCGSWDRTTLGISQMIPYPGKLTRAGRVALAEAIAARHRLEATKFALQAEVVAAWHELWLVDRGSEIDDANLALLEQFREVTLELVAVGRAPQADATKADLEVASAGNELWTRRAQRPAALAALNALLSRPVDAPLRPASALPETAARGRADSRVAAERNPEFAALAAEAQGRRRRGAGAVAYVPDLEIGLDVRGSMERMITAMITLPPRSRASRRGSKSRAPLRVAQVAPRARSDRLEPASPKSVWRETASDSSRCTGTSCCLVPRRRERDADGLRDRRRLLSKCWTRSGAARLERPPPVRRFMQSQLR